MKDAKTNPSRRQLEKIHGRRYQKLEGEDLNDPLISAALRRTYQQNDPDSEFRLVFWLNRREMARGTKSNLKKNLDRVEKDIKDKSKDARTREIQMHILANLAIQEVTGQIRKRED